MVNHLLAVIVLYNLPLQNSKTFQSILISLKESNEKLDILIYDNSYYSQVVDMDTISSNLKLTYYHDKNNSGLSKAYNYAAKIADKHHKYWVLFFDQDTSFTTNIFNQYNTAIQNNPTIKLFVPILKLKNQQIFSPCRYKFKRGFLLKNIIPGIYKLSNLSPVNSGILVYLDAFNEVGGYNNKVRLDFSDFQFIERYKKYYTNFCVIDAVGIQDFSNNEQDVQKLNSRYAFFCEGAKNCDRNNLEDSVQYFLIALMRASTLFYRTGSIRFYKTFFNSYLLK